MPLDSHKEVIKIEMGFYCMALAFFPCEINAYVYTFEVSTLLFCVYLHLHAIITYQIKRLKNHLLFIELVNGNQQTKFE